MEKIRMNLFAKYAMVLGLSLIAAAPGYASVTKVGNGDDGADLETLTQITSGPILAARQRAIETVKQLNANGIPGMGLLIPELEHSNLFMATKDVHPTGEQQGSLEISADKGFVYARTFAEPYAATRFFPIAATLTADQLVALHIHEALHRSLPPDIRTDENKVMHLTMAMTSPGASYDRVFQVASLYINVDVANTAQRSPQRFAPMPEAQLNSTVSIEPIILPSKSRTEVKVGTEMYSEAAYGWRAGATNEIQLKTSLGGYRQIGSYAVEPVFRFRAKIFREVERGLGLGTTSYEVEGRIKLDEETVAGPLLRFTAKSLDEPAYTFGDRDITTVGAFYRNIGESSYFESTAFYSFGSTSGKNEYYSAKYNPILSLTGRAGMKYRYLYIGGLLDIHSSEGREISASEQEHSNGGYYSQPTPGLMRPGFRILAVGPELGLEGKNFNLRLYAKTILNTSQGLFDDLGDVMDRGSGSALLGTSFAMAF